MQLKLYIDLGMKKTEATKAVAVKQEVDEETIRRREKADRLNRENKKLLDDGVLKVRDIDNALKAQDLGLTLTEYNIENNKYNDDKYAIKVLEKLRKEAVDVNEFIVKLRSL